MNKIEVDIPAVMNADMNTESAFVRWCVEQTCRWSQPWAWNSVAQFLLGSCETCRWMVCFHIRATRALFEIQKNQHEPSIYRTQKSTRKIGFFQCFWHLRCWFSGDIPQPLFQNSAFDRNAECLPIEECTSCDWWLFSLTAAVPTSRVIGRGQLFTNKWVVDMPIVIEMLHDMVRSVGIDAPVLEVLLEPDELNRLGSLCFRRCHHQRFGLGFPM